MVFKLCYGNGGAINSPLDTHLLLFSNRRNCNIYDIFGGYTVDAHVCRCYHVFCSSGGQRLTMAFLHFLPS